MPTTDASGGSHSRRFRRLHRSRVARLLADIARRHPALALDQIQWHAIAETPEWCLLSPAEIDRTRLLAGGLFMAPEIRGWIDGRRLQTLLGLLGGPALDAILAESDVTPIIVDASDDVGERDPASLHASLLDAGATVLLGAVGQPSIRVALAAHLMPEYAMDDAPLVDVELAQRLSRQAMQMLLAERASEPSGPMQTGRTDAVHALDGETLACSS